MENLKKTKHRWSENDFKSKLKEISPNLTLISKFTILKEYVKVIDELGIIYCSLAQTFLKNKPTIKSAIDKNEAFSKKSSQVHKNKYDYSKVNYIDNLTKVIIVCPIHGEFKQAPNNHLNQLQGCSKCKNGGWGSSKENWLNFTKGKNCILYIIKCYNESEEFIKIGITSNTIEVRFFRKDKFPYNYDILWEVNAANEIVWDLEQKFKKLYQKNHYFPKLEFGGKTECYNTSDIFNIMNKLKLLLNEKIKNENL